MRAAGDSPDDVSDGPKHREKVFEGRGRLGKAHHLPEFLQVIMGVRTALLPGQLLESGQATGALCMSVQLHLDNMAEWCASRGRPKSSP